MLLEYTMEYYSAIKRNEIVPFAETWMNLETVIQREVRKRITNIVFSRGRSGALESFKYFYNVR